MIDDESIRSAIHATIAKQVLEGLDTRHRDAILEASIAKALTDYRFTSEVNDVVAAKAARVAAELVESEEWGRRIRETIRDGFVAYLDNLRAAMPEVLKLALHGKDVPGNYSQQMGFILKCWPRE